MSEFDLPAAPRPIEDGSGLTIAGYGPLRFLARGGSATVYLAVRDSDGAEVAVKVHDGHAHRSDREVETRRLLDAAAHILPIVDSGSLTDGRAWIATPYARRGTVEDLRRAGPLPVELVTRIGIDTAQGLALAHAAGIVHADIKPSNLFVAEDGSTMVGDFGSAQTDPLATGAATMAMTLLFTAPEVLKGDAPTPRSDVYSLGLTLYALTTGRNPFEHEADTGIAQLAERITTGPAPQLPQDAPAWLADVVRRCTALDPNDRYPDASHVAADLDQRTATGPLPRTEHGRRPRARIAAAIAAVAIVGAVVIGAVIMSTERRAEAPTATAAKPAWQRQLGGAIGVTPGGYDSSARVDTRGRAVIAHTDLATGHLLLTRCLDPNCVRERTRVVSSEARSAYYPSLQLSKADHPVIAYQNSAVGALEVRRCADADCVRSTVLRVPLPEGLSATIQERFGPDHQLIPLDRNVSLVPRLVLRDDVPVVAFDEIRANPKDEQNPLIRVWVAMCTSSTCENWTNHPITDGAVPSLALDAQGRPVLAGSQVVLQNLSFGVVWIARCEDQNCMSVNTITTKAYASTMSLAVLPSGQLTAVGTSYNGGSEADGIWLVTCPATCTEATVTTRKLVERSQPDGYPSIGVRDGHVVIAFLTRRGNPPGVSLIECPEPTCGPTSRIVSINSLVPKRESVLDGGDDPSLAIDQDGTMVVSSSRFPPGENGAKLLVAGVRQRR